MKSVFRVINSDGAFRSSSDISISKFFSESSRYSDGLGGITGLTGISFSTGSKGPKFQITCGSSSHSKISQNSISGSHSTKLAAKKDSPCKVPVRVPGPVFWTGVSTRTARESYFFKGWSTSSSDNSNASERQNYTINLKFLKHRVDMMNFMTSMIQRLSRSTEVTREQTSRKWDFVKIMRALKCD